MRKTWAIYISNSLIFMCFRYMFSFTMSRGLACDPSLSCNCLYPLWREVTLYAGVTSKSKVSKEGHLLECHVTIGLEKCWCQWDVSGSVLCSPQHWGNTVCVSSFKCSAQGGKRMNGNNGGSRNTWKVELMCIYFIQIILDIIFLIVGHFLYSWLCGEAVM